MRLRLPLVLMGLVVAATAVVLAIVGHDDERFAAAPEAERSPPPLNSPRTGPLPAMGPGAPPEVRAAAREWPLANHDYANTRATSDSSIDSHSVRRLGLAWRLPLRKASHWGAAASAPIVAGGVVYAQ